MDAPLPRDAIVELLRRQLPGVLAVYAYGSRVNGTAGADSDLDLAVLTEGRLDATQLWALAGDLATRLGNDVDLVDLRAATTVMQHQVISTGQRWWARPLQADLWEAAMLSEKTALDEARAGLIHDALERGTVHGR